MYGLSQEVWKLESKLEMFKKQMEIKNGEMEKINDKVLKGARKCLKFCCEIFEQSFYTKLHKVY